MIFSARVIQHAKFLIGTLLFIQIYTISDAIGDDFDTFNAAVGSAYSYENNLFRLPDNTQPSASGAQRSDNILINSLGIRLNKKYSLQAFKVNFDHVDTQYANASFLDFKANNYNAAWLWALTPRLTGTLSSERTIALIPFQDLRVQGSTSATALQNYRTTEVQRFAADYSPHDKWHVIGSIYRINSSNSQVFLPETSFVLNSVEGGLKYEFASQSTISLVSRDSKGENSVFNPSPAFAVGKGFDERQQELSSVWLLSGKSTLVSNIGHTRRTDDTFAIRDFSGMFGGINYTWAVTGKTTVSMGISRTLAAYQTSSASYGVVDKLFFNPIWYATSKITVRPNFQLSNISFEGQGPSVGAKREDDSFTYGIAIDWKPRSTIKLGLNFQHNERNSTGRSSTGNLLDYSADTASINGQLTF